ncbi:phage major capsid protein, P2 family [Methylobacter sp. S3L5C]|uniref:phage major capsid protein, P2 family n=1 Tax=Methylobacter sp. S3L5C TaxID=2839024 RepID=UPI001FAE52D4|nr:phage major capsid protein, P2 family [Methylobacter sp. S3L5C]UOA08599.1 phage major capsid protein, P2 family [Methylobacter sp. S3L5C]
MNLCKESKIALTLLIANTALAFNAKVGEQFSATPIIAQTIYQKIVENGNAFLSMINVQAVSEVAGEKVGVGVSGRVASRTDTSGAGERLPKNLASTLAHGYQLFATEFDIALKYAQIDAWAKNPNFALLYMQAVREAIANDMLQVGWTGTSAATATNIANNPLLQDLNIGWLQLIRGFNSGSQRVIGTVGAPVSLGTSGTFKNLDVLAHVAKQRIAPQFRNRPDLVLLVGANVLANQEQTYYTLNGNTPTEKAMTNGLITRAYAGLPTIAPPFMPDSTLLITPLKNLSIYYQDSSVRRLQKDKPEKNEVQEFNSVNQGYVVEEELATSFVENITFV